MRSGSIFMSVAVAMGALSLSSCAGNPPRPPVTKTVTTPGPTVTTPGPTVTATKEVSSVPQACKDALDQSHEIQGEFIKFMKSQADWPSKVSEAADAVSATDVDALHQVTEWMADNEKATGEISDSVTSLIDDFNASAAACKGGAAD